MLFGDAAGDMGKTFSICKCNVTRPDLMSTRVLQNLHAKAGFMQSDGWSLLAWSRMLTLKNKQNIMEAKEYKRLFLRHTDGSVMTVQAKAWMDSSGIAMWCDTVLGPHVRDHCEGKAAMIWDNCGSHNSDAIKQVFASWGVELLPLPPKLTDQLQILDLVVNAPLKAGIRRQRVERLFAYFQNWKFERLRDSTLPANEQERPPFNPPKPTLVDGLTSLLHTVNTTLSTP